MPRGLRDTLDLARGGRSQIDSQRVGYAIVNTPDQPDVRGLFNSLSGLNSTLGSLANHAAEESEREARAQYEEFAKLKAFQPEEYQRRLAAGEIREVDHPSFHRLFAVAQAQKAAEDAQGAFAAFDLDSAVADEGPLNEFIEQQRQGVLSQSEHPLYQGTIGEAFGQLEGNLRSRVQVHRQERQKELLYENLNATASGIVRDAVESGAIGQLPQVLGLQIERATKSGANRGRMIDGIIQAAAAAIGDNPALEDNLGDMVIPGLDRPLRDYAPGKLEDVAENARARAAAKAAADLSRANAAAEAHARNLRKQAGEQLLTTGTINPDTALALSKADPFFFGKLAETQEGFDRIEEVTPAYRALHARVLLGDPSVDLEAEQAAGNVSPKGYFKLLKQKEEVANVGDLTKRPQYTQGRTQLMSSIRAAKTALGGSDPDNPLAGLLGAAGGGMSVEAALEFEEMTARLTLQFDEAFAAEMQESRDAKAAMTEALNQTTKALQLDVQEFSKRHMLGESAGLGVEGADGETKLPVSISTKPDKQAPADPEIIRRASDTLSRSEIEAVKKMGGIQQYEMSAYAELEPKILPAIKVWQMTGMLHESLQAEYDQFRQENPDIVIDELGFLHALAFHLIPRQPKKHQ
jgi:hypothetical protein